MESSVYQDAMLPLDIFVLEKMSVRDVSEFLL